jgi:hypothetical protein
MLREVAALSTMQPNGGSNSPVPIERHALGTLRYIRASMEAAGALAVPGMAGVVMGLIGILAAALASTPALRAFWLEVWLGAAVAAFVLGGGLMARQAARRGHTYQFAPIRKFVLCLSPALIAGAVLTLVLLRAEMDRLVPGTWLLLYGCAVTAASTVTGRLNRLIACMGTLFMLLGIATFVLPPQLHSLLLGLGFGVLHLVSGVLIGRRHGD